MITDPHLIFAEVSLDISRGEFQSGLDKLKKMNDLLSDSYIFNLLFARTYRGLLNYGKATEHLKRCCTIAPSNQIAWQELIDIKVLESRDRSVVEKPAFDPVVAELEQLSLALSGFEPPISSESFDPTPIIEQKQPFPDDDSIAVPTESLANLFITQGAFKKAIKVYTSLIQLKPSKAEDYKRHIDWLLEKL
jgi:tetratricopeptide (TPR) repeat protein